MDASDCASSTMATIASRKTKDIGDETNRRSI
jgi:hypothetical protein